MITISKHDDEINISGHTDPTICSAISSITYTCINILLELGEDISVDDNKEKDYLNIKLHNIDNNGNIIIGVMFQMFNDVLEQAPKNSLILKVD